MRKYFTLFLFTLFGAALFATPVKQDQAKKAAIQFLKSNFKQTKATSSTVELVWSDAGIETKSGTIQINPAVYVFNVTEGVGFVVISGDDVAYPVIGYSDRFNFDSAMPSNVRAWLRGYSAQINWLRENDKQASEATKAAWDALSKGGLQLKTGTTVLLNTALWDQEAPYNDDCPTINDTVAPTGCVATSTAIAMKYHAWPDEGTGSYSYTPTTYGKELTANFAVAYNWDEMPMEYTEGEYTTQQAANVAQLMYNVGVFSQMDYGTEESGALTIDAAAGLVSYMKYDKGLQALEREYYTDAEWVAMVNAELDASRPVVYGGENAYDEGHQFVIDGYNADGYYHVNWGWSGQDNGYFLLDVLDPLDQGTGGNIGGFSLDQDAMFGMQKEQEGSVYKDVLAFFSGQDQGEEFNGLSTNTTEFIENQSFEVIAGFIGNLSIRNFTGQINMALTDSDGNIIEFISDAITETIDIDNGIAKEFTCTITQTIESGYQIRLMYKSSSDGVDEWQWVRAGTDMTGYIDVSTSTSTAIEKAIAVDDNKIQIVLTDNGDLQIQAAQPLQVVNVYDITGRMVKKTSGKSTTSLTVPMQSFSKGIYIIEAVGQRSKSVQKIVKR